MSASDLEQSLRASLPDDLKPHAPEIAQALAQAIAAARNAPGGAQKQIALDLRAVPGLQSLVGRNIEIGKLFDLSGAEFKGDLRIDHVAARDQYNITVSVQPPGAVGPPRPVRQVRVFISYCAADASARNLQAVLRQKLAEAGMEVLPDRDQTDPTGQNVPYACIELAHAGIVIVSPSALTDDRFSSAVNVLTGRYWLSESDRKRDGAAGAGVKPAGFQLCVALLDGLAMGNLSPADLAFNLKDIPLLPNGAPDIVAADACARLGGLAPDETPLDKLARRISKEFEKATWQGLENTARKINLDPTLAPSLQELKNWVALALWHTDVSKWDDVLNELAFDDLDLATIMDLIYPAWVNPCSARCLLEVGRPGAERRAIAVNGSEPEFTARSFWRRAYFRIPIPRTPDPIVVVNEQPDGAPDWPKRLAQQVRERLCRLLRPSRKDLRDEEITAALQKRVSDPIVIAIDPQIPTNVLGVLLEAFPQAKFPNLVFFLLTGDVDPPNVEPQTALVVRPKLDANVEQDANDLYWARVHPDS